MKPKCPECKQNSAIMHPQYGMIACVPCRKQSRQVSERTYEVIPERIKEDRAAHKNQTIQPFRNGSVSKEYLDLYGTKYIDVTEEEVKNAKNVWGEISYYKEH